MCEEQEAEEEGTCVRLGGGWECRMDKGDLHSMSQQQHWCFFNEFDCCLFDLVFFLRRFAVAAAGDAAGDAAADCY